jgi:ribonucleotide monophosphatase NagD (HAD superfamily)
LATNDDASLPQSDEIVMPGNEYKTKKWEILWINLGAGSILASVATASGRSPTILGKPHAPMFDSIRAVFPEVDPKRTVMIGDR